MKMSSTIFRILVVVIAFVIATVSAAPHHPSKFKKNHSNKLYGLFLICILFSGDLGFGLNPEEHNNGADDFNLDQFRRRRSGYYPRGRYHGKNYGGTPGR